MRICDVGVEGKRVGLLRSGFLTLVVQITVIASYR